MSLPLKWEFPGGKINDGERPECAMVGIPDGRGPETPILYIKKKEDAVIGESEIRNYLKGKIAQFKNPKKIIFIEEFPKTATGKIKKTELRRRADLF
jgi:acyl-CoA synthetase (AMP-forming)/AMP-acid ligase II